MVIYTSIGSLQVMVDNSYYSARMRKNSFVELILLINKWNVARKDI